MNPELFIIELLSSKEKIRAYDKENRRRNLLAILGYLIGVCIICFGLGTLFYRMFRWRVRSITSGYIIEGFYYFSLAVGVIGVLFLLVLLLKTIFGGFQLQYAYDHWLEKHVKRMLNTPYVFQERDYYYLSAKPPVSKIRLVKAECISLTTTLDDLEIQLGRKPQFPGIGTNQLFLLAGEPKLMPQTYSKAHSFNQGALLSMLGLLLAALAGVAYYEGTTVYQNLYGHRSGEETTYETSSTAAIVNAEGLLEQQGQAPDRQVGQTNQLELMTGSDELYLTTDNGLNWSFVPLKPEWLRFGSYLLTSGEIPYGYWMDNTYNISPEFSWFIYSQNQEDIEFLSSKDKGQAWQKSVVSSRASWVRYRKAQFFVNGSGVLVYSTASPEVSSEGLEMYTTNDFGQTWSRSNGTSVPQPVQNVSFVNPTLGFVSTREKLFYTNNSGNSFKEAVVTIPEGYQTGGLDLFQSPNEVIQTGTNQLETKFYLLKNSGIDQWKMFACLYRSSDNGETWQFAEQLSQVEQTD